jgi:nucleoside-diphosphate-sugar epimerase
LRVFVTGASGWIGSAVVPELVGAGHEVAALARSAASAAVVEVRGAAVVRGSVDDLEVLRAAAARADAVVHLAFRHDIAFAGGFADAVASDVAAIEAMGSGLPSGGAIVVAAGMLGHGQVGVPVTERDGATLGGVGEARRPPSDAALALAGRGLRPSVVRLSPTVHGEGDGGFLATLVDIARKHGFSGYPGDGTARWPPASVCRRADGPVWPRRVPGPALPSHRGRQRGDPDGSVVARPDLATAEPGIRQPAGIPRRGRSQPSGRHSPSN